MPWQRRCEDPCLLKVAMDNDTIGRFRIVSAESLSGWMRRSGARCPRRGGFKAANHYLTGALAGLVAREQQAG